MGYLHMKSLFWIASAKEDLKAMPNDVQDTFGFALHQAQTGKTRTGQAAEGFRIGWRARSGRGLGRQHISRRLHGEIRERGLCAALLPEEVNTWHSGTKAGYGRDSRPIESGVNACEKSMEMIEIEESSGNVYADLGISDADEMLVKAQLATKIGEIIKSRRWTQ